MKETKTERRIEKKKESINESKIEREKSCHPMLDENAVNKKQESIKTIGKKDRV